MGGFDKVLVHVTYGFLGASMQLLTKGTSLESTASIVNGSFNHYSTLLLSPDSSGILVGLKA